MSPHNSPADANQANNAVSHAPVAGDTALDTALAAKRAAAAATATVATAAPAKEVITVIKSFVPTEEQLAELKAKIEAGEQPLNYAKEFSMTFKKSVDAVTKKGTKRETLNIMVPVPSLDGIISIISAGSKGLELVQEAMASVVEKRCRDLINEDDDNLLNALNFPLELVDWEFIASMPKTTRRGGGIAKEVWEAFAADYLTIMPELTGRAIEKVENMLKVLANKLNSVKTDKAVLRLVQDQLAIYAENTENLEEVSPVVSFLTDKAATYLEASDTALLDNL